MELGSGEGEGVGGGCRDDFEGAENGIYSRPSPDLHPVLREQLPGNLGEEEFAMEMLARLKHLVPAPIQFLCVFLPPPPIPSFLVRY